MGKNKENEPGKKVKWCIGSALAYLKWASVMW